MFDERIQGDSLHRRRPDIVLPHAALPAWLAHRILHRGEEVTWVRGPRFCPSWEWLVTHPALFVAAVLLGVLGVAAAKLLAPTWSDAELWASAVTIALVLASIYILAIGNAYFTRLVVTTDRLLILQGIAVCRSWSIDELPPSLIHFRIGESERERTIDVGAVQTLLGGSADQFADAKTIRAIGRQIDRIRAGQQPRRKDASRDP